MDDTVQVNATFYDMVWKDMQLEVTDPSFAIGEPWQAVVANLGDATVKGMDISITAVLNENMQMVSVLLESLTPMLILLKASPMIVLMEAKRL